MRPNGIRISPAYRKRFRLLSVYIARPSTSMMASGLAISVEKTTGIPLFIPNPRSRLRTAFAKPQLQVFDISEILTCDGSILAPAPIEETTGIFFL